MLFNSIEFIFFFLPLTLAGYYLLSFLSLQRFLIHYLSIISIVFYYIGSPRSLPILLSSIALNYVFGSLIFRYREQFSGRLLVIAGVCANLGCLGYFKYLHLGLSSLNDLLGSHFEIPSLLLPLGISFYTFKQVSYLLEIYRGDLKPSHWFVHTLAVLFFPQLIAGPIVLHRDLCGQLSPGRLGRFGLSHLVVGLSIFSIGLFKRNVIADWATPFSDSVFDHLAELDHVPFFSAWTAALCYTLQLYFDFSGYSDMAVGVARMFGVRLMTNFYSPLKATSVLDYWRRWHITLQQIIGRYLFQPVLIPLSRLSVDWNLGRFPSFWLVTVLPTLMTFVLVGLWHGASWNFVVFGVIHAFYLSMNEAWRMLNRKRRKKLKRRPGFASLVGSHVITLVAVVFANVLFRSNSLHAAAKVWSGMIRVADFDLSQFSSRFSLANFLDGPLVILMFGFTVALLFPNTNQFFHKFASVRDRKAWVASDQTMIRIQWQPTVFYAVLLGCSFCLGVAFILRVPTKFIYFNF